MSDVDNILLMSEDELDRVDVARQELQEDGPSGSGRDEQGGPADGSAQKKKKSNLLNKKKLQKLKQDYDQRGVVYLSRIPPHMKPLKLRQLLGEYGEVRRVFCTPEDPRHAAERRRQGKKERGKNFTEGWVEFEDKRIAKRAALLLNGQPMGGKRRSAYHYDLWCIKYLPKFKWDHLTEQVRYERAVRQQKLAAEVSAGNRERDFYLSRVDKAKQVAAIAERRQKQQQVPEEGERQAGGDGGADEASGSAGDAAGQRAAEARPAQPADEAGPSGQQGEEAGGTKGQKGGKRQRDGAGHHRPRFFGQRRPKADPVTAEDAPGLPEDLLQLVAPKKKRRQAVDGSG